MILMPFRRHFGISISISSNPHSPQMSLGFTSLLSLFFPSCMPAIKNSSRNLDTVPKLSSCQVSQDTQNKSNQVLHTARQKLRQLIWQGILQHTSSISRFVSTSLSPACIPVK